MYELTKKNVPFKRTQLEYNAFQKMKQAMTSAPVLRRPICEVNAEFLISIDASKYGIGTVFLQKDEQGKFKPCAYFAKSLSESQRRYSTYDQELLVSICIMYHR